MCYCCKEKCIKLTLVILSALIIVSDYFDKIMSFNEFSFEIINILKPLSDPILLKKIRPY